MSRVTVLCERRSFVATVGVAHSVLHILAVWDDGEAAAHVELWGFRTDEDGYDKKIPVERVGSSAGDAQAATAFAWGEWAKFCRRYAVE